MVNDAHTDGDCRWLGLILGTRIWYGFWDADQDDDTAFDRRLSAVLREVGDRGKVVVSEAVPPFREPTPAPAPAPLPARSPALAAAAAASATPAPAPAPARAPALASVAAASLPPALAPTLSAALTPATLEQGN
eukprot:COSAG06_NODE_13153_length_1288_cov_1.280067_1_plen_133_part_10